MKRLSIAAIGCSPAALQQQQPRRPDPIPRPAPDDATPAGIAYLCDGRKEVTVVYAKNRASVTFDDKTWRMEYQPTDDGFRYVDAGERMVGPRRPRGPARERHRRAARLQLPAAAPHDEPSTTALLQPELDARSRPAR